MVTTSDLIPFASGSASIGVNQIGVAGFGNPVPYNHIHMMSGIWHDHSGQSGVLRYNRAAGGFEVSIDGGITFNLVTVSTTLIDLDDAYEIGNEINQNQRALSPTALAEGSMVIGQTPVIIKHATPGAGNRFGPHSLTQGREDAGIIASGFTVTPNLPNTFAYSALGPGFLHIQASGTQNVAPTAFAIGLGNVGDSGEGLGFFSTDAHMIFGAKSFSFSTEDGDGDILFSAEGTLGLGLGGQIEFRPFDGSGNLQFRFGPHQAWYTKLTHSDTGGPDGDGFWPLPHSGQIAQMIAQATPGGTVDLQEAYDNGNEIDPRRDLIGYKGILVRETIPGFDAGFQNNPDISANKPGKYGIAVSGHTLTPTVPNSYGFAALNSLSLVITSSGSVSALSRSFFLGYAASNPNLVFFNSDGSLRFAIGDTTNTGLGGQIDFRPFGGSGRLEYRFGPYQTWHARTTINNGGPLNDGYWPIAHSGNVNEMIARTPKSKAITIERPAVNNDLTIWYTNEAIFITEVESVLRGSFDASGSFAIRHSTDRSQVGTSITTLPITCTSRSTGQITTSFVSQSIPADSWLWIGVSGVSGVATSQMNVTIQYLN